MDKNIFTLRNLDADDIKAIELALGLEPKTISLKTVPSDAVSKQHLFVTIGYFDNAARRINSFANFVRGAK